MWPLLKVVGYSSFSSVPRLCSYRFHVIEYAAQFFIPGNLKLLPVFNPLTAMEGTSKEPDESRDVAIFEGSIVQVSQLLSQLERTSKTRRMTELKLKEVQSELG